MVCSKTYHNFSGYYLRLLAHFALFFGLSGYHLRLFFGPEFCSKIIVIMICSFLLKLWLWCAILKLPYHHRNFVGRIMMFTKDQLSALLHVNGKEGFIIWRLATPKGCWDTFRKLTDFTNIASSDEGESTWQLTDCQVLFMVVHWGYEWLHHHSSWYLLMRLTIGLRFASSNSSWV
mgnify:CR=1 FL=1